MVTGRTSVVVRGLPTQHDQRRRVVLFYAVTLPSLIWIACLGGLYWFAASFFLAKRTLTQRSTCADAARLLETTLGLDEALVQNVVLQSTTTATATTSRSAGCWRQRQVDSLVILVVDALRLDFAFYNLPRSIGHRLSRQHQLLQQQQHHFHPRLWRFVADPPTVTMQRLKALTTGGLPTFADISANFGGATVEEDSWMDQWQRVAQHERGIASTTSPQGAAFVGDDTWMDLFPHIFTQAYPYPSFNTRDLDTVDNGCEKHFPHLVSRLRGISSNTTEGNSNENEESLEFLVVHFLGVDHVGHTYGPNTEHMTMKLAQMDQDLERVLHVLDQSPSCHAALIFGDHGMTPDGNHGGGTEEETSAALFVYHSPGCPGSDNDGHEKSAHGPDKLGTTSEDDPFLELEATRHSSFVQGTFGSIHQIDLVPTISYYLGLPIPYANLGSYVPALGVPSQTNKSSEWEEAAHALALNAAQVWRYLSLYSQQANRLPNLPHLEGALQAAVETYKRALVQKRQSQLENDPFDHEEDFEQATILFKGFLQEALELGQRVWTRFDDVGMISGICVLSLGLLAWTLNMLHMRATIGASSGVRGKEETRSECSNLVKPGQTAEVALALIFMLFQCGILTFSNSYILEEDKSTLYCLGVLSIAIAMRLRAYSTLLNLSNSNAGNPPKKMLWWIPILLSVTARLQCETVTGHGLDPSIPMHTVHQPLIFGSSLLFLVGARYALWRHLLMRRTPHMVLDVMTMVFMGLAWSEKRITDPDRNGYRFAQITFLLLGVGFVLGLYQLGTRWNTMRTLKTGGVNKIITNDDQGRSLFLFCKLLLAIMVVTGPSTAPSLVLYVIQTSVLYQLSLSSHRTSAVVLAALVRLVTRHVFFSTNHGCAFNRLQYSAAFVATKEFNFALGGISLFLNTFGWEVAGLWFAGQLRPTSLESKEQIRPSSMNQNVIFGRSATWCWYLGFQLTEALTSCISVCVLRRHLMVWDIYAPHFLFVAIFTVLHGLAQLSASLVDRVVALKQLTVDVKETQRTW